jgi:hypothetical protein
MSMPKMCAVAESAALYRGEGWHRLMKPTRKFMDEEVENGNGCLNTVSRCRNSLSPVPDRRALHCHRRDLPATGTARHGNGPFC